MKKTVWFLMFGLILFVVSACGSGGDNPTPATVADQITCPDGTKVPLASGAGACPVVSPVSPVLPIHFSNIDPRAFRQELTINFNGLLDPSSVTGNTATRKGTVVLWKGDVNTGIDVSGVVFPAEEDRDPDWHSGGVLFVPTQGLAYGQSYSLDINIKDSVDRPVHLTVPITTMPMVCTDSSVWSTPALFSTVYQDCVAPIGVQTQVDQRYNTLQDGTCAITVGTPLTQACKAYFDNGTMVLASTGVMVNGHPSIWMTYLPISEPRNIVLLEVDPYDPLSLTPVSVFTLSPSLTWIIGNPTGAFIHTNDGKSSQLTVGSDQKIVSTCVLGCQ